METTNDILQGIAFHVCRGRHSHFLRTFADAYLLADEENRKLLRPAWKQLIDKYLLKKHEIVQEED